MALKKSTSTVYGFDFPSCYYRIEDISNISKTTMAFQVRGYSKNPNNLEINLPAFYDKRFICDYDLNGDNVFKQAYAHLKTLSEFNDAMDC